MPRRPPRNLSAEERALWQRVADATEALHSSPRKSVSEPAKMPLRPTQRRTIIRAFSIGEKVSAMPPARAVPRDFGETPGGAPVWMDRKRYERMKRGKLAPEARIDLHGMTLAQAKPALTDFILRAHASQKRLVLVITGKGRERDQPGPIPVKFGVLKHEVPHWLTSSPLDGMVLQIESAHQRHGGGGAIYVYLRRVR